MEREEESRLNLVRHFKQIILFYKERIVQTIVNIIIKEISIDEELKTKLKFICEFANVKPTFINDSIKRINKTNMNYIEPNKMIVKNTTFLVFNGNGTVYIENLNKHICISELKDYLKNLRKRLTIYMFSLEIKCGKIKKKTITKFRKSSFL